MRAHGSRPFGPEVRKRGYSRRGFYWRNEDSRLLRRYQCSHCKRSFSAASGSVFYRQKKRTVNGQIEQLLSNTVSLRAASRILRLNRKTVVRKSVLLGMLAKLERVALLDTIAAGGEKLAEIQFDEMETFERSKCLPLSIPLAVDPQTRRILGIRVARMPANGPLAQISRKKYGHREDERPKKAAELFAEIAPALTPQVEVLSDQNPKYPGWIRAALPEARLRTVKGQRGASTGQGELKRTVFDPLFALNHSAAMLRANVCRLIRKTWCTTKRPDRLEWHLELYIRQHNLRVRGGK
jgi:hypothetical protein